jgi:hypothetical protein
MIGTPLQHGYNVPPQPQGGLIMGNKSSSFLEKALGTYKMILSVVELPNEFINGPGYLGCFKVLRMAVFSNSDKRYVCRKQLEAVMAVISPDMRFLLDDDEYIVFFLNAPHFSRTTQEYGEWVPAASNSLVFEWDGDKSWLWLLFGLVWFGLVSLCWLWYVLIEIDCKSKKKSPR